MTIPFASRAAILGLVNCWIGTDGVAALGEALMVNATLAMLSLDRNRIEKKGAEAMGNALKVNTTLRTLNLDNSNMGRSGRHVHIDFLDVLKYYTEVAGIVPQ
jgi:Ran GTPase-activating protein (RanGAP) involved in mRNA processing and transport